MNKDEEVSNRISHYNALLFNVKLTTDAIIKTL